ncbi:hypothetical protein [Sporosalibacterium faouarense]|uniref:hypothetical protein n=1 Tax=Sporosalibacterium faouarense TaxID=516123 RepID=UPI00141D01D1|nr:hypothetical protein [Sporosalibacterium faouarense]MTI47438.1 hypothetical protein [Bacillota bacterium]
MLLESKVTKKVIMLFVSYPILLIIAKLIGDRDLSFKSIMISLAIYLAVSLIITTLIFINRDNKVIDALKVFLYKSPNKFIAFILFALLFVLIEENLSYIYLWIFIGMTLSVNVFLRD